MDEDLIDYKDRSRLLRIWGGLLLAAGVIAGFLAPLETYCFYLFSAAGRFHYDGFGFGSFMFGNIYVQVLAYYLLAVILITMGYGHLNLKKWASVLSVSLLYFWLIVGAPLIVLAFFILTGTKAMPIAGMIAASTVLVLFYFPIPQLFIRFYKSYDVKATFAANDEKTYWVERVPIPILTLCLTVIFYVIVLHILILFNGIFALFGSFVYGMEGVVIIDILALCMLFLVWGLLKLKLWAWWGSVIVLGFLAVSTVITFLNSSYLDILSKMKFAAYELEFLDGLPLEGFHFALMFGIPLIITLVLAFRTLKFFNK